MDNETKPVVDNKNVHVKKKSKAGNFLSNFVSDLIVNVVVPDMKRTATNLVSNIFDASKRALLSAMNFDTKGTTVSSKKVGDNPSYISYNDYWERSKNGGPAAFTPVVNDYAYNEITFDKRSEAELVRSMLIDILRKKKVVTVGDYYALCNIQTTPTDFDFGWLSLDSMQITMHPQGYRIKLPRAMPIER